MNNYQWFLVAKRFLAAGLSSVRDKELELRMGENILLRDPFSQQDVVRLSLHLFGLPLPDDPLLQAGEDFDWKYK